jgi:tetratricopeptide (TPR) repeat protein
MWMVMRRLRWGFLVLAALLTSCSGDDGSGPDGGVTLPWSAPFIEQGYSAEQVLEVATSVRDERAAAIPATVRDALAAQIALAVTASPSEGTLVPDSESEAWSMAGVSSLFQGSLAVATWCFANSVLEAPDDEQALSQFGWALLADDRIDEAKGVLLYATELEPQLWTLWSNLGHAYEVSGESDRAIYYFGRGLEYHPESLNMHLRLGGLMLERGDLVAASAHAAQGLAISPEDPEANQLADEVAAAGGDTAVAPTPTPPRGDGMREVLADYDACVEDATRRYSEAVAPWNEWVLEQDVTYLLRKGDVDDALPECEGRCRADDDGCFDTCFSGFCADATANEFDNYLKHLQVANADMSYSAAWQARMRGCAYAAVEAHEDIVSEESIQDFIVYVNDLCEVITEGDLAAFQDERADIANRLPVATGCSGAGSIPADMVTLSFDLESLGISVGMEGCLDGFACITFGDTTIGFSVGVDIVSGGIEFDYENPDVIFSLGVGYDVAVGSAGVDLKASIRRGFGISPNVKVGGVLRTTYARDFWLLSF